MNTVSLDNIINLIFVSQNWYLSNKRPLRYSANFLKMINHLNKKFKIEPVDKQIHKMIDFIKKSKCKKLIIVAYTGCIFYLINTIFKLPFDRTVDGFGGKPRGNCSITCLHYDKKDGFRMLLATSTSHLD